jgi:hypothetical protein
MKTSLKKVGAFGALSIAALGVMSTSAMGLGGMMGKNLSPDEIVNRQTSMFTEQASLIGATIDEVKNAWAEGKDITTLATEKGVTKEQLQARMKVAHEAKMKAQLAILVNKGVITQAQADKRFAAMQSKTAIKKGGKHGMHNGMGMMGL